MRARLWSKVEEDQVLIIQLSITEQVTDLWGKYNLSPIFLLHLLDMAFISGLHPVDFTHAGHTKEKATKLAAFVIE